MPFRERGVPQQLPDLRAVSSSSGSRHLLPLFVVSGEEPEAPKDLRRMPCPRGRPGPSLDLVVGAEVSGAALHKGLWLRSAERRAASCGNGPALSLESQAIAGQARVNLVSGLFRCPWPDLSPRSWPPEVLTPQSG